MQGFSSTRQKRAAPYHRIISLSEILRKHCCINQEFWNGREFWDGSTYQFIASEACRPPAGDIRRKAFVGLLCRPDFYPTDAGERNFDPPAPRVLMCALALPAQVNEASCGRPMRECTAEHGVTLAAFRDFEGKLKIL
jgi:hypothetical protein